MDSDSGAVSKTLSVSFDCTSGSCRSQRRYTGRIDSSQTEKLFSSPSLHRHHERCVIYERSRVQLRAEKRMQRLPIHTLELLDSYHGSIVDIICSSGFVCSIHMRTRLDVTNWRRLSVTCRHPILSGGYELDKAERHMILLKTYVTIIQQQLTLNW